MTVPEEEPESPGFAEFVALMAMLTSLGALSIDGMLPALPQIGRDLGVERENTNQLVVSLLLLGLSTGQLFYGPVSDSTGRKPTLLTGMALYIAGCVFALVSQTFPVMLVGRLLQGFGVAGARSIVLALVRDRYRGPVMARVISVVMAVFILVPIVAPSMGQAVLFFAGWRAIFGVYLVLAVTVTVWFVVRQPETLPPERRIPLSLGRIARSLREVMTTRSSLLYTIAAGFVFGGFVGYLTTAQQMLQVQYGLGERFPLYFAMLAFSIGVAALTNTQLVGRFGMRPLSHFAVVVFCGLSVAFFVVAYVADGQPPLAALMAFLLTVFFCAGLLFGNINALAMEPLGHIAGAGAAVVGSLSSFLAMIFGTLVGQAYDGTVLPLIGAYAVLGFAAFVAMRFAEPGAVSNDAASEAS